MAVTVGGGWAILMASMHPHPTTTTKSSFSSAAAGPCGDGWRWSRSRALRGQVSSLLHLEVWSDLWLRVNGCSPLQEHAALWPGDIHPTTRGTRQNGDLNQSAGSYGDIHTLHFTNVLYEVFLISWFFHALSFYLKKKMVLLLFCNKDSRNDSTDRLSYITISSALWLHCWREMEVMKTCT